jgi:hypothetical protein
VPGQTMDAAVLVVEESMVDLLVPALVGAAHRLV